MYAFVGQSLWKPRYCFYLWTVTHWRDRFSSIGELHNGYTVNLQSWHRAKACTFKNTRVERLSVPRDQALPDHTKTFVLEWCRGRSCYFRTPLSGRANSLRVVRRILCKQVIPVNLLPFFRTSCRHASHWGLVKSTTSGWRRTCGIFLKQVSSDCFILQITAISFFFT